MKNWHSSRTFWVLTIFVVLVLSVQKCSEPDPIEKSDKISFNNSAEPIPPFIEGGVLNSDNIVFYCQMRDLYASVYTEASDKFGHSASDNIPSGTILTLESPVIVNFNQPWKTPETPDELSIMSNNMVQVPVGYRLEIINRFKGRTGAFAYEVGFPDLTGDVSTAHGWIKANSLRWYNTKERKDDHFKIMQTWRRPRLKNVKAQWEKESGVSWDQADTEAMTGLWKYHCDR